MIFRGKKLSDLQLEDLQRLITDHVQERDTVEYKRDMYGNSRDDKREMLKDIISMANHHGGYLIIGIDEDEEGIPKQIVGIEPCNQVEQITNSCLDNIDKRIVGLGIKDVSFNEGRIIVVVSVPESINAPHMVTHEGLNQFWKRHGRQKDKMTIDEIGEAFDRRLSNLSRLERFIFTRRAKTLESIGDQTQMVITASPTYLRDEVIFNLHDDNLRQMMLNPPHQLVRGGGVDISCGKPYPTINGLRADQSTPYYNNPSFDQYIEVFSNGHIEFGKRIEREHEQGTFLASLVEIPLIVSFMAFIQNVYERYVPLTPLVVGFSIYNAKGVWLAAGGYAAEASRVKWQDEHLELGNFYAQNISEERKLLTKQICDRLWRAFNRERCNLFDDAGTFREPR